MCSSDLSTVVVDTDAGLRSCLVEKEETEGSVVVDMGDVRAGVASFSPRNWNYSAGPGLRYDSPIGIFRLDVGFRLNETDQSRQEPRIWAIHLGLGESF